MITAEEAARITGELLKVQADDPAHPWELIEFPQGWIVCQHGWEGYRGGASLVIERAGPVMRYPSYVPPPLIIRDYEAVREEGRPDDRWPARALALAAVRA